MSVAAIVFLLFAGFFSGVVNAIAGGGTFLTFGALTLMGLPPVAANATSSIIQFPGYVTSTFAYRSEFMSLWKSAFVLAFVSALGALGGALVLMSMSNPAFRFLVPWLLLAATAIFAIGPKLRPAASNDHAATPLGLFLQAITSLYGGFFGAGMGIMMLASLGLATGGDYHRLNAIKNFLSIVIAAVAIIVFSTANAVSWFHAAMMLPAAALGGFAGAQMARRAPQQFLRIVVILAGLALALYYLLTG